jgi:gluconolactonase
MTRDVLLASLLAILAVSSLRAQMPSSNPTVVRLDPAPDSLVSSGARLRLVKNDSGFTERVVWVDEGKSGDLLLSDMQANVIYKVTPEGKVPLDLYHSRYTGYDIWRAGMPQPDANRKDVFFLIGSKGLAVDRQGRLLIAKWSGRSIGRIEKNRKRTILADR